MRLDTLQKQGLIPAMLALLALLALLTDSWSTPLFQYDRVAVGHGEIWRLVTGHLLHTNRWHLLMNVAGLAVIVLMHGPHYTICRLLCLWFTGTLLISLALWFWSPDLTYYVGLSGWLHALLVWGACQDIQRHWSSGWLILAGVLGKILWEQWQGASQQLVMLIQSDVATDAHWYGAVTGLMLYVVSLSYQYWHGEVS